MSVLTKPPQQLENTVQRIKHLRQRVLAHKNDNALWNLRHNAVVDARSLRASDHIASWPVRLGLLTRDRLASMHFVIDELELLAGHPQDGQAFTAEQDAAARTALESFTLNTPGQTGHCELDFDPVMRLGIDGLGQQIEARLDQATGNQAEAYRSFLHALDGLSQMIAHAADAVESAIPAAAPTRQVELKAIVASCRHIAHAAPASFRDAIQLLWFIILAVMHGERASLVVPGHLDRTLYSFYQADTAAGILSGEQALALIECLYLLLNEYIPDGLAISVLVGGRDAQGKDVTNDLSYLCLEALRRTGLIYPAVGVCWHEGTPDALLDLAVDLMGHGYPTPAVFGDETIQRGLR
ncbi:MAG: hypothetical protein JXA89_08110, partial [Anaerolineae bacterium]|nr:hypothetical protein [Anaerolineae bacterium]